MFLNACSNSGAPAFRQLAWPQRRGRALGATFRIRGARIRFGATGTATMRPLWRPITPPFSSVDTRRATKARRN
jgi:hypothetical protein